MTLSGTVKFVTEIRLVVDDFFLVNPVLEVKYREAVISSGGRVTLLEETDWEKAPLDIIPADNFKYYD